MIQSTRNLFKFGIPVAIIASLLFSSGEASAKSSQAEDHCMSNHSKQIPKTHHQKQKIHHKKAASKKDEIGLLIERQRGNQRTEELNQAELDKLDSATTRGVKPLTPTSAGVKPTQTTARPTSNFGHVDFLNTAGKNNSDLLYQAPLQEELRSLKKGIEAGSIPVASLKYMRLSRAGKTFDIVPAEAISERSKILGTLTVTATDGTKTYYTIIPTTVNAPRPFYLDNYNKK